MKRYTYTGSKWVLVGMIVPILMFFFAMNTVYAYFTATAKPYEGKVSTGDVKLVFKNDPTYTITEELTETGYILPGQSIGLSGTIVNTSSNEIFAIIKVQPSVDGTLGQAYFYTPSGKLLHDSTGYKTYVEADVKLGAPTVDGEEKIYKESSFNVSQVLGFNDYNNNSQGKEVKFYLTGLGIQTKNISLTDAVEYLVETLGNK